MKPAEAARVRVVVKPGAHEDTLYTDEDGACRASVTARPQDGQANRAVCALLARRLGIPKTQVQVVRGARAREKTLEVAGLTPEALRRRLGGNEAEGV